MACVFRLDYRPFPLLSVAVSGCPFRDDELVELSNGQTWCRFHLPMIVDNEETPKARWSEAEVAAFNDGIFAFIDAARHEERVAGLWGIVFPGDIFFEQYRDNGFPEVMFVGARFSKNAWFDGAVFSRFASFEDAKFLGGASFQETTFRGDASFRQARFGGEAHFSRVDFRGEASFQETRFRSLAWFQGARFRNDALFEKARFHGDARFQKAKFNGLASFDRARLCGDADFSGTAWDREWTWRRVGEEAQIEALFPAENDEAAATFSTVNFGGAQFFGTVRFHNRKFLDTTDFRGTYFESAPEFHGCTLHQDTLFPKEANFRDRNGAKAALAYRTLKHAMASVHARGEEAKFYSLEQKSLLRDKDTPFSSRFLSGLYWLASDYGQSVLRPFVCLLLTLAAFFAIYIVFLLFYLDPMSNFVFPAMDIWDVLRFSLRQVFRPFEVFSLRVAAPAEAVHEVLRVAPLPLAILAAMHSVLTLSCLALFLLALRRRFKLD